MDDATFDAEALAIIRPSWADRDRYADPAAQVAALRALADRRVGGWTDTGTGDRHDSDDYGSCRCREPEDGTMPPANFGPCACACSCWDYGYDGLCDACRMNIHSGDRPRPRPVLVNARTEGVNL